MHFNKNNGGHQLAVQRNRRKRNILRRGHASSTKGNKISWKNQTLADYEIVGWTKNRENVDAAIVMRKALINKRVPSKADNWEYFDERSSDKRKGAFKQDNLDVPGRKGNHSHLWNGKSTSTAKFTPQS